MYAWSHSVGGDQRKSPADAAKQYIESELSIPYKGIGMYTTEKDTLLVTVQDLDGERASGSLPEDPTSYRIMIYVFNAPFHKTVWASLPRNAYDTRPV